MVLPLSPVGSRVSDENRFSSVLIADCCVQVSPGVSALPPVLLYLGSVSLSGSLSWYRVEALYMSTAHA